MVDRLLTILQQQARTEAADKQQSQQSSADPRHGQDNNLFDQQRQSLQYSRKGGDAYAAPDTHASSQSQSHSHSHDQQKDHLGYNKSDQNPWGGGGGGQETQWEEEDSNMFAGL